MLISLCRDPYPSRDINDHLLARRREPVIWSSMADRPPTLTVEQALQYEEQGWCVLPELLPRETVIDLLAARASVLGTDPVARQLPAAHAAFEQLARHPDLLACVRFFVDSDVYLHQSAVHAQASLRGQPRDWMSDFETWHIEDGMPGMRAVMALVVLEQHNRFHAPLTVLPRSHLSYIGRPADQLAPETLSLLTARSDGEKVIDVPAGSVVLLDCNLMHAGTRQHINLAYNSVLNTLQSPRRGFEERPAELAERGNTDALTATRQV